MERDHRITGIGDLADLDLPDLRQRWRELYHIEPPVRMSRELLIQAIAYRMQERILGGLSPATRKRLVGSGRGTACNSTKQSRVTTRRQIKAGTRFLREWQGRTHEVTATEDGRFRYGDASYASLSEIARKITGTRWSGPAFFGLKQNSAKAHAAG